MREGKIKCVSESWIWWFIVVKSEILVAKC